MGWFTPQMPEAIRAEPGVPSGSSVWLAATELLGHHPLRSQADWQKVALEAKPLGLKLALWFAMLMS